ncbi:site-specific integrase [Frondihabitans sp. 762G35]|uniref:site-specific integrase n=1 Tax=Frondihabitans sp. 762G35 TaxID=1446794 RepID=UPI000F51703E|nr:site-specific integrase [Frondihabitans sp. 762G35]
MSDEPKKSHAFRPFIDPAHWEAIRDLVEEVVRTVDGIIPYPVPAISKAVAGFALWCWQSAGLPLDAPAIFTREVIAYYAQVGCGSLTAAARGNRRSLLLRVSEVIVRTGPGRLPPLPPSDPSEPYDRKQLVSVVSWARGQSTQDRRANAHLLVALGLGAGLSAQEIIELRTSDVRRDGRDIDVFIRQGRERMVPMLREFADIVPDLNPATPDAFAFRPGRRLAYVNAISNFVARSRTLGLHPQSQRMRATWIVRHLDAGTPLRVLTKAAGLESLDALARFERFITDIPADTAIRALRYADQNLSATHR